jgi:glycosyltransferase involved in cell wall biosynthesis
MAWLWGMFDEQLRRLQRRRAASAPLLISLVVERFEDGAWSGVPRFDWELRKAFPELISLALTPATRRVLAQLARARADAVVITGNETSLSVPNELRTIVVHHGCAQTHFDRDPEWRTRSARRLCAAQRAMYQRPNRSFVSASAWASQQFSLHYRVPAAPVIPHWVPALSATREQHTGRKLVLGDFRTWNKGSALLPPLTARLPQLDIRPLVCTYDTRQAAYARADAYLSLSVSEGGSYALCDAEVAGLPIVMTDVGNCQEFSAASVIPWETRADIEGVARALEQALAVPRGASFYEQYSFERWRSLWHELLERVRAKPLE